MGSGKSSIAKILQTKLNWPVRDTDEMIEKKVGKSINDIFKQEGEEKFRDYETQILSELKDEDLCIVSTGGGIIEKERNHKLLKNNSVVFYLKTTPENILKFTAKDSNRPLLQVSNPLEFITEKLNKRIPTYLKLGEYQIETFSQSLEDSANEIVNYLKLKPPFNCC